MCVCVMHNVHVCANVREHVSVRGSKTERQNLVSVANELIVLLQVEVFFYTHLTTETKD